MSDTALECLQSYREFRLIREEWNDFMERCFPDNYSRSHSWLSAWWETYHHDSPSLVYLQRRTSDGSIVAAAPLLIKDEVFGGFPVRSLQAIGSGIGADDFLIGPEASGFVSAVFSDLVREHTWHVCRLQRSGSPQFQKEVRQTAAELSCYADFAETGDYYVTFPSSYKEYLQSRSSHFRRNMNNACNRLKKEGAISLEVLDPFRDAGRVEELGREVSSTSWQYREGKSHFNDKGSANFYANLTRPGKGTGGEEFTVLQASGRPVAYLLGCRRGRTYFAVDTAFHSDYRHISAGRVLYGMIFERLIEQGDVDYFDFEGSGEYKDDYATDIRSAACLTIYNRSFYPGFIRLVRGSGLYSRLREYLGRGKAVHEPAA